MKTNTIFWSYLAQFFLEWEMLRIKYVGKFKQHIFCSITHFENPLVYDIMWKTFVESDRPQMTIWRMRIACWIPKAANTLKICNTYCFTRNNGCKNTPQCYIACFLSNNVIYSWKFKSGYMKTKWLRHNNFSCCFGIIVWSFLLSFHIAVRQPSRWLPSLRISVSDL